MVFFVIVLLTHITDAGPFMPDEDEDEGTPFGQDSIILFGTSTTAKGLFDESDEEKDSSGGFAAAISGKKSTEESSEDADKESPHSFSKWTSLLSDVCMCICVFSKLYVD